MLSEQDSEGAMHPIRALDMTTSIIESARSVGAPNTAIPRIAIVGAGFTGTLLAVHLLREAKAPLAIHLIEQHGWVGRNRPGYGGGRGGSNGACGGSISEVTTDSSHVLHWNLGRASRNNAGGHGDRSTFCAGRIFQKILP